MNQRELKDALNQVCGKNHSIVDVLFYTEPTQLIVVVYEFRGFATRLDSMSFKTIQDVINHFDKTDRIPMTSSAGTKQKPLEL